MALRFTKRFKIAPGINLNLSKSGLSTSMGPKGLKLNLGKKGAKTTVGIPGTGLSSTHNYSTKKQGSRNLLNSHSQKSLKSNINAGVSPMSGCLAIIGVLVFFVLLFSAPKYAMILGIIGIICLVKYTSSPKQKSKSATKKAVIKFNKKEFAEAIPLLIQAEKLDPSNQAAKELLGMSYYQNKDYVNALPYLERLHSRNETQTIMYANSLNEFGKFNEAIEQLQGFNIESELYINALIIIADSFIKEKHWDAAIETLKKAPLQKRNIDIELLPIHYMMGIAYTGLKDSQKALKAFNKVKSTDINYKDVDARIAALQ